MSETDRDAMPPSEVSHASARKGRARVTKELLAIDTELSTGVASNQTMQNSDGAAANGMTPKFERGQREALTPLTANLCAASS